MKVVVTFVPKEEEVEMKKMVLELDLSMPASKVRIQFPSLHNFFQVEKFLGRELVSVSMIFYDTSFLQVEKLLGRCLGVEPGALRLYKCFSARLSIVLLIISCEWNHRRTDFFEILKTKNCLSGLRRRVAVGVQAPQ